jgi:hypothetical protein
MGATAARLNWVAANRRERAADNRDKAERFRTDKLNSMAEGYDARAAKNERVAQGYNQAARFVTFAGWGSLIAGGLNGLFNRGKVRKAEKKLATKDGGNYRSYGEDFSNPEELAKVLDKRSNAAAKKGKYENQRGTARGAGALIGGAAGGAALGAAFHHFEGGHTVGGHHEATAGNPGDLGDPIARAHGGFHAEINRQGEGMDLLYRDLRDQLAVAYKGHAAPPVVAEMLKYKTMDEFSRATGFEHVVPGGDVHGPHAHIDSATMHMHDRLDLSPDGRTLTLHPVGGGQVTIMHETPGAGLMVSHQQDVPMRDYSHQAGGTPEHAPAARTADAAGDAKVPDLNRAQVKPETAPPAAPPNVPPRTFNAPNRPVDDQTVI